MQNNFLSSKMNRDKDARLVPRGEYREGRNINVSKSEGANVGALENILGNDTVVGNFLISLQNSLGTNNVLEIIGLFSHDDTSSLYLFLTTFTDNSPDQLSNKFQGYNYIIQVKLSGENYTPVVLLKGEFLNFSKTHRVLGFNIIENLLFFSDNRNQPRKINIDKAFTGSSLTAQPKHITDYYFAEDQISVAKFAPYEPIKFIKNTGGPTTPYWSPTWKAEDEEWLPPFLTAPINSIPSNKDYISFAAGVVSNNPSWPGTSLMNFMQKGGNFDFPVIKVRNYSVPNGGTMYVHSVFSSLLYLSLEKPEAGQTPPTSNDIISSWNPGDLLTFQLLNPEYEENLRPRKYLEERFARFSYRFKYDDNEYSLMAPFTQPLFVPKQYGSFKVGDEGNAAVNTILNWFTNLITSAELNIILPDNSYYNISDTSTGLNFINRYKVEEIQVLIKSSNDNNVYSIGEIPITTFADLSSQFVTSNYTVFPYDRQLIYKYRSAKPFQVLPESAVLRVSDIIPVKAKAQEVAGNRVMYANYQNSHAAPSSLEYEAFSSERNINNPTTNSEGNPSFSQSLSTTENPPMLTSSENTIKEHYNSTIKQGRTYQVGVILADRFGRQSNVILANNNSDLLFSSKKSEKSTVYVPYDNSGDKLYGDFFGGSIKTIFTEEIPSEIPGLNFYPGLYDKDKNPLGWYSYKIVVKQSEQEYYNVYLPGSTSGNVTFFAPRMRLAYKEIYEATNLSIYGDNINKIPKNTTNISPTDKSFGSDTTLTFRVFQTVPGIVTVGENAKNIWFNVQNNETTTLPFSVVNIQAFRDFGPWTTKKGTFFNPGLSGGTAYRAYPSYLDGTAVNYIDPFYNADKNPFIATVDISSAEALRVGFSETVQAPSSETAQPEFSKFLAVAETNPVESNLDIYWETTSSGLISDLNKSIREGDSPSSPDNITSFLFLMEEQYPYDGIGNYEQKGKELLVKDINILTLSGLESNNPNAKIELLNASSTVNSNISTDVTDRFEIVSRLVSPGASPAFNLQLASESAAKEKVYDPDVNNLMQNNLTFSLKISIPGETPSSKVITTSNNQISNNKPNWKYLIQPSWGSTTVLPNPTSLNSIITTRQAQVIYNKVILQSARVGNSPFIPIPKKFLKSPGDLGIDVENSNSSRNWNLSRNVMWTMSIGKNNEVFFNPNIGNSQQFIGRMFKNSKGENKNSSVQPWWGNDAKENSTLRFNFKVTSTSDSRGSSNGFLDDMVDGSFLGDNKNLEPYIEKCELAVIDNDSYENFSIGTESDPTYGDQGVVPVVDWFTFKIVVDSNAGKNGPQSSVGDSSIDNDFTWGYRKLPFDVKLFDATDNAIINHYDSNGSATRNQQIGRWVLLADPYNPPFCQVGANRNNGNFRAEGQLNGSDICVYKLTIGIKEKFSNGTSLSSNVKKVIYVKLVR